MIETFKKARRVFSHPRDAMRSTASARIVRAITALQATIQRDEGGRGIAALCRPNQLLQASQELLRTPSNGKAIVLTGFPCLRERSPPVETDGPPGAVAIARALVAFGVTVSMPIEHHSRAALQQCMAAACTGEIQPTVVGFPTSDEWGAADDLRLQDITAGSSIAIAIERAGTSSDGTCYTMRALPMGKDLVAYELNSILTVGSRLCTVAVGDGGNELGMGSLYADVSRTVPNGAKTGCIVPSDFPIVASVSNWGGYALCCACALLAWDQQLALAADGATNNCAGRHSAEDYVARLVPDARSLEAVILAANDAGAVDGINGQAMGSVDGMPLRIHLDLLDRLRAVTLGAMNGGEAFDRPPLTSSMRCD